MRCSNCGGLLDGTPECPSCGHVNHDAGPVRADGTMPAQPALDPDLLGDTPPEALPAAPPEAARGKPDLRSKLGAPRPASAPDFTSDATAALPAEGDSATQARAPMPASRASGSRPPAKRGVSGARPPAARARPAETTENLEVESVAPPTKMRRPSASPAQKPSGGNKSLVQPGKYASVGDVREPESTVARPELQGQAAAGPPPVNPEEVFHNVVAAVKAMSFEDRLESFSAAGMLLLGLMPWRAIKGESDVGLLTSAGFLAMLLSGGVLGLIYLRLSHRVVTLTAKLLSTLELVLAALPLPLILFFIFSSIDRHEQTYGSLRTYTSVPEFGSVLALLCNFAMAAGAALVMAREKRAG